MFYFHPYLGKIPILTNIFQMGWNHQLDIHLISRGYYWGPYTLLKGAVKGGLNS